jgi:PAS domain S-box-containing protein
MADQQKTKKQLIEELEELRKRVAALDLLLQRRSRLDDTVHWLETALDTMQLGVTIVDQHGVIQYTNPTEAAMHGYEVKDLIGKDVSIFVTTEQRKPLTLEQLSGLGSWQRESVNVRKDGSTFPVYLKSDPVRDINGTYTIVTTCEDITARKHEESTIDDIQSGYLLAAASANDGLWDWDLASDYVYYTPRWGFILGRNRQ